MSVARPNTFLGIALTKTQKATKAIEKRERNRIQYLSCKQNNINKGKVPYPDDPKGPCKTDWKQWQKWRGKAGERAIKLAEKLEVKGKGDPMLLAALHAEAESTNESTFQVAAMTDDQLPSDGMTEELTIDSGPPWLLLGGAAVGVTILGIAIYKFRS